jgi:hypothetical protein
MFRAMVWKELRGIRGIALLALAVYALLLSSTVMPSATSGMPLVAFFGGGRDAPDVPFVYDNFLGHYCWISFLMAIAIGLQQTLSESGRGTYLLLLHRPARRRWLIGMKLFVGLATYLICGATPILVYGGWAATHAMLFEWSMTLTCWRLWFAMTLPYLGAFLTGIRPGRWYGSRLLPLLAIALPMFVSEVVLADSTRPSGPLWYCVALLVIDVWMIAAIFFVARTRDFS